MTSEVDDDCLGLRDAHGEERGVDHLADRAQALLTCLVQLLGPHAVLEQGVGERRLHQVGVELASDPGKDLQGTLGRVPTRLRDGLLAGRQTHHRGHQLLGVIVLGQVGVGAGAEPPEAGRGLAVAGQDDHRQVAGGRVALEQA